jgi:hypothetical protein
VNEIATDLVVKNLIERTDLFVAQKTKNIVIGKRCI